MAEGIAAADAEQRSGADDSLTIEITPTPSALVHASAAINRAQLPAIGLGGYAAAGSVIGLFVGAPPLVLVPAALIAAALLSGYYSAPLVWFTTARNPDLVLGRETTTFNADGVQYRGPKSESRRAWSFYRRARDVGSAVVLEGKAGGGTIVLTSDLDAEKTAQLRRILQTHGLFRTSAGGGALQPFAAFLIGAAAALLQVTFSPF